ncbi:flagellar protein FlaG [Thalassotalea piscium]|uniref:Flagellar protein FlaG n=1 Tax=Thalassotalea piscium TaxID=1230533 RepID=A0A7X0NJP3_9GAMM|nr:flagellar protein FlaG [Thalassotalea piscium]MBB6544717.1 flagellar protein FlaG [Thalassotalea piscium]
MVKPVSLENPLTNQFSEMASNTFKSNNESDADKERISAETNVAKTESNENKALKNVQEAQVEKSTEESVEELEQAFEEISQFMNMYNRNVNFSMDEKSEKTVIKVFDSDSKELIKQFPSEDLVKLAQKIKELRQDVDLKSGIFLDEKV